MNRTFGCVRVVWNQTLAWRRQRYHDEHAKTSYAQASAYLSAMKATEDLVWLNEVSCVPLQQAVRHQQAAFANFFAGRARYPRFKSRAGRQSAEYTRSGFRYRDGRLRLAKTDSPLAFTWSWPDIDPASIDPATVTVSREPDGRWYVSFAVETAESPPLPEAGRATGVDLGIKRSISDCGWGAFRRMIEYKAERAGRRVIVIDRFHPSSKACSACGHLLASLSLSTRHWTCPSCGTRHDRDVNAAKNILAAGLAVARSDAGDACGADVRHSGTSRVRSAVKQEPRPARAGIPVHQGGE